MQVHNIKTEKARKFRNWQNKKFSIPAEKRNQAEYAKLHKNNLWCVTDNFELVHSNIYREKKWNNKKVKTYACVNQRKVLFMSKSKKRAIEEKEKMESENIMLAKSFAKLFNKTNEK